MKKYLLIALFAMMPCFALAQGTTVSQSIVVTNSLGRPLGGVKVEVCTTASSSSPACSGAASIFSDSGLSVSIPCSASACLTTDSMGQVPIFFASPGTYCYVVSGAYITDTSCHLIILYAATGGTGVITNPVATQNVVQPVGTNLNVNRFEAIRYADQFAGADWCAKVNAAETDLPTTGGTIDARGIVGVQTACTSANITLSKPTHLIFGAGTYALGAEQLLTSANGVSITGDDITTTIISYTGNLAAIYGSLGAQTQIDFLTLTNFTLDGTGAGAGALGVQEITPFGHRYTHIKVLGFTQNIKLDGSQNYGTLNILDHVISRSCITTALWIYGNADLTPIYSGRVVADTTIIGGDFHCLNGGTSIKLESAAIVYLAGNLIENASTGTGTGIVITGNSATSKSQDIKIMGNDFEGLATGTSIDANATRTTMVGNDYFSVTTQVADTGTETTQMDLDATVTDLYRFAKGLDLNFAGTALGARMVNDLNAAEPRTCWYRPTGGGTWFPFCVQNTNDVFQIIRADATATIGTLANAHAVLSATNTGVFTFADNTGATTAVLGPSGLQVGASGSTIADTRELLQNVHFCGTTSTCANTANGSYREVFGSVALSSGTPSQATITAISPAFTSTATYFCTATPEGATAVIAAGGAAISKVSGSSFTITGPNTVTTVVDYHCVGN